MLNKFIASSAAEIHRDLMRSDIAWVPQLASEGVRLETFQAAMVCGDEEEP